MPFDEVGVYQRINNFQQDRDAGIKILSSRVDAEFDSIAAALNDIVSLNYTVKAPYHAVLGSASQPAYGFSGDVDTGMFRKGANSLGFSVGGIEAYYIASGGGVVFNFDPKVGANKIWHAGNDGTDSGLDADKLDNQEGSYYRDAGNLNAGTISDARLPTTITKNTSGTHSGNVTGKVNNIAVANFWHSGNDGSGSGLDADKVDGIHASQFLRSDANDTIKGLLDFSRASDQQMRVGYNTGSSRNPYLDFYDGLTTRRGYVQGHSGYMRIYSQAGGYIDIYGSGDVRINGSKILRQADEGSGKGIDADTVDGKHASDFASSTDLSWTPVIRAGNGSVINYTDAKFRAYKVGDLVFGRFLGLMEYVGTISGTPSLNLPAVADGEQLLPHCWSVWSAANGSKIENSSNNSEDFGNAIAKGNSFYFKSENYNNDTSNTIDNGYLLITFQYLTA